MFNRIEMVWNPKRKPLRNWMLSPIKFERQQETLSGGVHETRDHPLGIGSMMTGCCDAIKFSGCHHMPMDGAGRETCKTQQKTPLSRGFESVSGLYRTV